MPRFGKDKDARKEELDRQAAEEVERLTRRGGPPGMGGGGMGGGMGGFGGPGGPPMGMPSPLEMMAAEIADGPRPVSRGAQAPRRAARPKQAFTPMPSGEVGSSFGPGGLNPGPRGGFGGPPPPAFGGGMDDDYGGHVTGPSVYYNAPTEPDEDEEMTITELALMDHAKHTGHRPEDLVMQYDAGTAEEMRDEAMRKFYERQQSRRPGGGTDNPFAPAGMRRGPTTTSAGPVRRDDPAAAGGALAARLANKRRREEEEARRAQGASQPAASAGPAPSSRPAAAPRRSQPTAAPARARAEAEVDEGALARVLARRRAALGVDAPQEPETTPVGAPIEPAGGNVPSLEDMVASTLTRSTKKAAAKKAPAAKKATKAATATKAAPAPAKAPAKAAKAPAKAKKAGATLAKPPAAEKAAAARPTGKTKTIFCIECGEKNPAIAKFCFNCGNRLAVPEG